VDVSGHGVGAAMMSLAVARQFLHGRVVDRFCLPQRAAFSRLPRSSEY
jgi:sigma-B regulation protein RsbU (phosphoserine phosphatase)